ncbi:MAG: hypothetical protein ABIQ86_06555 [Steroidobacteraceae bacterium]
MNKKKLLLLAILSSFTGAASAVVNVEYVVPEIDPASIGSAVTLLLGGLTVLRSRFSRK